MGKVELEILSIVWEKGEASSKDVYEQIRTKRETAYTTIMTMMGILYDKKLLSRHQKGRAYIYKALKKPSAVKKNLLSDTLERVFKGSRVDLVHNLVSDEKLSQTEIDELKEMINKL